MNCRLILTEFRQCLGILIVLGDKVLTTTMRFISAPLFFLQTRASSCCLTPFLAVSFSYIGLSGCIYYHDLFFSFFPYCDSIFSRYTFVEESYLSLSYYFSSYCHFTYIGLPVFISITFFWSHFRVGQDQQEVLVRKEKEAKRQ